MATAEQLKALFKSYATLDDERFLSIALQVAAHEAKQGHAKLARDLRTLIDQARAERKKQPSLSGAVPLVHPRGELAGLFSASYPKLRLSDMVLDDRTARRLQRVLSEQRERSRLRASGLSPRRKILLVGPSGTGKTMTAAVLAGELRCALFVVRLEALITKFMGETAAKLRLVFDAISTTRGVYLFDEFDSIGTRRAMPNELGEIRRVLNSFLQFIEQDQSDSLILAATNHPQALDRALFRRFDDVIAFDLPTADLAERVLRARLAPFNTARFDWEQAVTAAQGHSHAEITRACEEAAKAMILKHRDAIDTTELVDALRERSRHADEA